jgi:hypothetical protein
MERRKSYLNHILLALAFSLSSGSLTAYADCRSTLSCYEFPKPSDLSQLTSMNRTPVFEDAGTIIVYRGNGCAESKKTGTQDSLYVQESLDLPRYAGNATVFLNGWRLRYLHGEHYVRTLGTSIYFIRLVDGPTGKTLLWNAGGSISDNDFKEPYTWCYYYTVVAWNPVNLALVVDHDDGSCSDKPEETRDANYFANALNEGATTALSAFPSFIHNPSFAASKTVAVLPRGFGFAWADSGCDHQLLQLAYNLDHGEIFMEKGKKYQKGLGDTTRGDESIVDQGYMSWETYAILKDNDTRRDYRFGEIVSGLGGSEVGVVQPPFSILPAENEGSGCGVDPGPVVKTTDHKIDTVPYEYAIPMLTGWELTHLCEDQEVAELGAWIDDWSYDPNNPGTLRYKLSTSGHGFYSRHKITVLGLRPVTLSRAASPRAQE